MHLEQTPDGPRPALYNRSTHAFHLYLGTKRLTIPSDLMASLLSIPSTTTRIPTTVQPRPAHERIYVHLLWLASSTALALQQQAVVVVVAVVERSSTLLR